MINKKVSLLYGIYSFLYDAAAIPFSSTRHTRHIMMILLLELFLSGCGFYKAPLPDTAYCYLNPDKNLFDVGKVVIIELNNDSTYPQASVDVTEALFQELQKKQLFSLRVVPQNDPAWRSLQLDLDSSYTLERLFAVRKTLSCDAMLIGTITRYKPYPHMVVGLRLKLVDLKDGQLLWAIENVWDVADKVTECRIKDYFRNKLRSGSDNLREKLVMVSQIEFIKFVASQSADTMMPKK